jgi:hypothetical protein
VNRLLVSAIWVYVDKRGCGMSRGKASFNFATIVALNGDFIAFVRFKQHFVKAANCLKFFVLINEPAAHIRG